MASGIRVTISSAGAKAILKSRGVADDIGRRAIAIATEACRMTSPDEMNNAPYMADGDTSGNRAHARVFTASEHGVNNNRLRGTLLRSLHAGR